MLKKYKTYMLIYLILLVTIFSSLALSNNITAQVFDIRNANLVLDALSYNNVLPKNFRKTSDLTHMKNTKNLNLNGLDKLNISGSQQFSAYNLPILIRAIGTSLPVTVVDLRQEAHGFINGFAVSWENLKNNANADLTKEQVLQDETYKLKNIKLNIPLTFYNHPQEIVIPTSVQDESNLIKTKSLSYIRITVTDGGVPKGDMVDYFIDSIKSQPQSSWLHFHCKQGVGRTGTFMIMYDMVKNHKVADADSIIERQLALGNYSEEMIKSFYNDERITFLKKFYDYCKINGNSFNIKWSEWEKAADNSAAFLFWYIVM